MKFVCDSCHAQYMISDDKVGANGVKVRCKKCSNIIVVKKVVEPDPTMVMQNPLASATNPGNDGAPFGGLDMDEIGQAFDSVLSSGPQKRVDSANDSDSRPTGEMAAAGANGDSDHESTRVVDLKAMAGMAAASAPDPSEERTNVGDIPEGLKAQAFLENGTNGARNEVNGHANGTNGTNGIPQSDWYAAINEEQTGPMSLDTLKGHWEAGRVTSDSLVWRNGYGDWKPLSTVSDLVKVLTPIPTPRKAPEKVDAQQPAGATASGPQLPAAVAAAPAAVPDPDEVDWKPAAASALASLVADEMEALSKPPVKARPEPVGVGETTGIKPALSGFDVPAPPAESQPSLPAAPAAAAESPAPSRLPEPEQPRMVARPAPIPPSYPSQPEMQMPVYPAPAAYIPPAAANNNTKYIVAGAGVVVLCLTAIAITFLLKSGPAPQPQQQPPPQQLALNQPPPPTPAPVQHSQPAPQPVAAQPVAPTPTPAPAPAPTPAPQPTAVAAKTEAPKPMAAAEETLEQKKARFEEWKRKHPKGAKGAAEAPPEGAPEPAAERVSTQPKKSQVTQPAGDDNLLDGAGKSKTESDFDKLLGGGGSTDDSPKPTKKKGGGSDVYIPPAVNNLPDQLGQGDIMGVVAGHKSQIVGCIQKQKARDPDSSGVVKMHWVIQKNGGVSGVSIGSDEFRGSPMGSCMSGIIKSWKFPQFSGAPMPIDFPFKF